MIKNETLTDLIRRVNNISSYDDIFQWLELENIFSNEKFLYQLINGDVSSTVSYIINNQIKIKYNALIYSLIGGGYINLVERYIKQLTDKNNDLIELHNILKYTTLNDCHLNNYMNNHFDKIMIELLKRTNCKQLKEGDNQLNYLFLKQLIDEILQKNNMKYQDITYLPNGGTCNAFHIGDLVIKFGQKKRTYKIPYHKRILVPYMRKYFYESDDDF